MNSRAAILLLAVAAMAQAKGPDSLVQARQFYNDQRYDDAIRAAKDARATPALASAATVILSRAHLERFRQTGVSTDLDAAREALKTVRSSALGPRDRVELLIALGESLYLDDQYSLDDRFSAAAEQFELALGRADLLDATSRDLLFDWWAGSLDRQAQQGEEAGRPALYARILTRAERELASDDGAASASYWIAASARGVGDLVRAIGAAVAGWVRAATLGDRGLTLRADLDRLMKEVILPERARELSPGADPRPGLALLEGQWQQVREKWQADEKK